MGLSNKIREFRFIHGEMTQKELAELVGVSRQTMNSIENNKHAPAIDVVFRIANVFGTHVEDVFRYQGSTEGDPESPDGVSIVVYWDDDDGGE